MSLPDFLLSWTPILLIFVLAVFFRTPALRLSVWGCAYAVLLVLVFFQTPPSVILMAALDGVLTTVPLLLVVYCGILLSVFLLEKGSLQRLAVWLSGGNLNPVGKSLLLSFGVGNFLEGAGVIAEPVAAPMLRSSGIAPAPSAALSIVGYSGLMHLSLAGVIVTVLAAVTGIPGDTLAWKLSLLSFPATMMLCLSLPWLINTRYDLRGNLPILLITGMLTALFAAVAVKWVGFSISGMIAGIAVIGFSCLLARHVPGSPKKIWRDVFPFAFVFVCLASVNLIPPLRHLAFERLVFAVELIPGHLIRLRPFFDAYAYLFLAFLLAFRLHGDKDERISDFLTKSSHKAVKAVIAMALFGAMGQVIAYSGYGAGFSDFDPNNNVAVCLAQGLIDITGRAYPLFAPFLGWVGTFLTGYGVASIMLFGKLQTETATMMGISPSLLVCALTVGASVGSVSSPFKIAIATPLCGAEGMEGEILRKTIPLGIGVSFAVGLFVLLLI